MNELRSLLSTNQSDRLKKEKAAQDRIDDPRLPRHTVYKGDRKIQQLGQDTIENGLIINNQSVSCGDVMLPLAKGNVLRRVDNTNGGALLGTAYRDALENDYDANGNRRNSALSRNGGNEPSDPNNPNKPRKPSDRVPPPFGCVPPPSQCFWSTNPIAPDGFQNHGDAVVNENAQPTYLHCKAGASVPANLGCDFLNQKWSCSAGVCSLDPNGSYSSQAECEAATRYVIALYVQGFPNSCAVLEESFSAVSPLYTSPPSYTTVITGSGLVCGSTPFTTKSLRVDGIEIFVSSFITGSDVYSIVAYCGGVPPSGLFYGFRPV